jgi:hypothetical protein
MMSRVAPLLCIGLQGGFIWANNIAWLDHGVVVNKE